VDEAVLREWLVNMGRRPADQRIAHMFCEVRRRLDAVGLAPDATMDFPLSQTDLADSAGLSPVHVNRMIQQLRDEGLISWRGRVLQVLDVGALEAFAGFDPNYLHLGA
jgi:CRP-like cAMP-binding protein